MTPSGGTFAPTDHCGTGNEPKQTPFLHMSWPHALYRKYTPPTEPSGFCFSIFAYEG